MARHKRIKVVRRPRRRRQTGGALTSRRGPRLIDRIAYGASMFLSGPAPTFATAGGKLAGQAVKGIADNIKLYKKRKRGR